VAALGGGHGLAASLRALRRITGSLTAVVGVADDGGSSGRLRRELGVLPPGDLRMALAALCGDDAWGDTWSRVVQHRFGGTGDVAGHAVGNLLIAALWQETGDVVAGLDWVAALLGAQGRVLPVSLVPMEIVAEVRGLDPLEPSSVRLVRGQVEVATTAGDIVRMDVEPAAPPACPQAVAAIEAADAVVLGPGSWYTSVLPHLQVPGIRAAVAATRARRVLVLNLTPQPGETSGFRPETHLEVLRDHVPELRLDVVLADPAHVPDPTALDRACAALGATLELAPVSDGTDPAARHDPEALAEAFRTVLAVPGQHGKMPTWR
jgi:uncharacterized cofD-like protein